MSPEDFRYVSALVKERSGLVLTSEKTYLLASRLEPVACKHGFDSLADLARDLRQRQDPRVVSAVVEAMTTNESFFFRDKLPFDLFQTVVLPKLMAARAGTKSIRIWSAAASTGQEAYSLAMLLKEMGGGLAGWRIEILASDLSSECLARAKKGLYTQFEVQRGLPVNLMVKYFKLAGSHWEIDPAIRAMVHFQQMNLLEPFPAVGTFDIVFCRNVLIYFDVATKQRVLAKLAEVMPMDGVLILGAAETVVGITDRFCPIEGRRGLYCPASEANRASLLSGFALQAVPATAPSRAFSSVSRST